MGHRIKPSLATSLPTWHGGIRRPSNLPHGGWAAVAIALLVFSTCASWAQAPVPSRSDTKLDGDASKEAGTTSPPPPQAESQSGKASAEKKRGGASDTGTSKSKDESKGKQTNRILWVVPNFAAVNANTQLPPLSVKGKFWLATEDTFDYSGFVWTAILSGQDFATKAYPEFGQGMAGYGRYYYHLFIDGVSGSYFTEAIVPSLTHEDPRYYTLGHGGFFRRAGYALSRVVITKTDSEGQSLNWSEVVGNLCEAGLANACYPAQERGARATAINWGTQLESAALNNMVKEFWPDLRQFLFRK